jgi:hypothetical protein
MNDDGLRVLDANRTPLVRVNPSSYEVTPIATNQKATETPKKPAKEASTGAGPPLALIALGLAAATAIGVAVAIARATKSRPPKGTVPYQ